VRDDTVENLVTLMLMAASECTVEEVAEALHSIAVSTPEICSAFNKHVDRAIQRDRMKPVPLTKLATKNDFGAN